MQFIATLIGVLITSAISFFGAMGAYIANFLAWSARTYAVWMAKLSVLIAITLALWVCLREAIISIATVINPPAFLTAAVEFMIPAHFTTYFAMIIGAKSCKSAWYFVREKLLYLNA